MYVFTFPFLHLLASRAPPITAAAVQHAMSHTLPITCVLSESSGPRRIWPRNSPPAFTVQDEGFARYPIRRVMLSLIQRIQLCFYKNWVKNYDLFACLSRKYLKGVD